MAGIWDQARVRKYIDDGIEESLNLDYKAAGALAKTDGKRKEVTKDVSAMANSDGGIIIYGMTEQNHLPDVIDPVNRKDFSKEWLEHVIGNIRPRIDGLLIHPVPIGGSNSDVVYIVEIPQSQTAHQATDKRYYKRHNFESVAMEHFEILDVLNRQQHPRIELDFETLPAIDEHGVTYKLELNVKIRNIGNVLARFIEAHVAIPNAILLNGAQRNRRTPNRSGISEGHTVFRRHNRERFAIGNSGPPSYTSFYGTPIYVPLFPGLEMLVESIDLIAGAVYKDEKREYTIKWSTFADSAAPNSGEVVVYDSLRLG
ncbi:MAG: ATP-binding protein [Chloroflexi bacterium]|nr:ATP-binding protein [Chloroflexota bacterium]